LSLVIRPNDANIQSAGADPAETEDNACLRAACIDIGSNTTRLLVAEVDDSPDGLQDGRLRTLAVDRAFTSIGAALRSDGSLPAGKIAEVAGVVAAQAAIARRHGARSIRVVATAAIRAAANRRDLADAVAGAAGIEMEVLSGDQEARLAFVGALASLPARPAGRVAVVDVGGGSTELVVGTPAGSVVWSRSVGVGSSSLTASCVHHDPPSPGCLAALERATADAFAGLDPPAVSLALAVGGSATTLLSLDGDQVDPQSLAFLLAEFTADPVLPTAVRLGLHPDRTRLLPAGIVLLMAACDVVGGPLRIARGGLREGVVLGLLG
jgi:exopolyphosphatase / guanosine-5'-triphosphate,3'-diphosphate pyrophosphatase